MAQGVEAVQQNHEVDKCMLERRQCPRIRVFKNPSHVDKLYLDLYLTLTGPRIWTFVKDF